jgi:hypothetical protein
MYATKFIVLDHCLLWMSIFFTALVLVSTWNVLCQYHWAIKSIFDLNWCHPHQDQIINIKLSLCQVVPRWHEHWTSNKVYDGDMIVFQGKRRYFFHNPWEVLLLMFTHTQADRFVLAFHSWLRWHGHSQPVWFGFTDQQPLPSAVLSKHEVRNPHPPFPIPSSGRTFFDLLEHRNKTHTHTHIQVLQKQCTWTWNNHWNWQNYSNGVSEMAAIS